MSEETAVEWSLRTWSQRHEDGYFPNSEEHRDWKVYESPPDWLIERGQFTLEDRVLEIGCGYGEWMIPLAPMAQSILGIDMHPAPLQKGIEICYERGIRNVAFMRNNGTTVPADDESFSRVYSISVFQHLPRSIVYGYLAESVRVVTPDGLILHHFRNADNVGPYPPLATDIAVNHTGDFSVGWTKHEIEDAGLAAGMKDLVVVDIGLFLLLIGNK
jgi:ubiquinone/menaquinone biosynthesis C-methylase UbiE